MDTAKKLNVINHETQMLIPSKALLRTCLCKPEKQRNVVSLMSV